MFSTLIRNYKNAGVKVSVTYCVQPHPDRYDFEPVFTHASTGLEIHNLANQGFRHLLSQAKASSLPRSPNERFEDIAWKIAAYALEQVTNSLRTCSPNDYGINLPYLCLLAEQLSKEWRDGEARDVCISRDGEVIVHSIAGMHTASKKLGKFRTH